MTNTSSILSLICEHSTFAPGLIVFIFLASGFFLPISEELLFLGAGILAGTCLDHSIGVFYIATLIGSVLAAWETFFIGRFFSNRWHNIRPIAYLLTHEHLELFRRWTKKWGVFLFFIVRFCPGGIRNAFFLSLGVSKTHFYYFAPRDFIAALPPCTLFFSLGVIFSAQGADLLAYAETKEKMLSLIVIALIAIFLIIFFIKRWRAFR